MKKLLGSVALTAILATSAMAADVRMPVKAPPAVVAPVFSWTGFYVGFHGGYARSDVDWAFAGIAANSNHKGDGAFFGGQVGANWQTGIFVIGVELDGSRATIDGGAPCPNPAFRCGSEFKYLASARGRAGITAGPLNALWYGTGGWGWGRVRYDATPFLGGFSNTVNVNGWTAGGGVEVAAVERWSFKIEYLAYVFGNENHSSLPLNPGLGINADPTIHTIKFGANFKLY